MPTLPGSAGGRREDREDTPLLEVIKPGSARTCPILICAGHAFSFHSGVVGLLEIDDTIELGRGMTIGSSAQQRPEDPHTSRMHARRTCVDREHVAVRDLESRNGTFLDGQRLQGEAPLHNGAILFAGAHVFVYRLVSPEDLLSLRAGLARPFGPVPTLSPIMARLFTRVRQLATSSMEILPTGETGVGKEVLAETWKGTLRPRPCPPQARCLPTIVLAPKSQPGKVPTGDAEVIVLFSASVGTPQAVDTTFAARFRPNPALGPIIFHEDPSTPVAEEDWPSDLRP
jgi:hypothetical protein